VGFTGPKGQLSDPACYTTLYTLHTHTHTHCTILNTLHTVPPGCICKLFKFLLDIYHIILPSGGMNST